MSRVFVARDLTLDRDIVVKVLSSEASNGVSAERFRREIQVIAKLQHPHVVSILSAGVADGALYYTMPFVTGETLRARLVRDGALPVAEVVRLLREVLDALAFAHEHGVVHRDIKPENVLISAGHAVVADFGIAKALRESGNMTSAGYAIGTPAYMAPEQATADPTTDHRADLYSVGVVGYELLTGVQPFTGSAQQLVTAHLTTPAPGVQAKRAEISDELNALIAHSLEKEPSDRPQSASEMIAILENVATPAATAMRMAAEMASKQLSLSKPASRKLWPFLVAGIATVAVIATALVRGKSGENPSIASTVKDGADIIAVMPLTAVSDTSLARLGQDLVVTLSANLDGVGSLHTVDAVTLLMRARKLSLPIPLADARKLAKDLGASSVLTGTLINEGANVRATVTLARVGNDSSIAKATALALPHEIAALTDSLTWSVLKDIWRGSKVPPSPVLAGRTTKSFDALRAFLDGERNFLHLNVPSALQNYRRAFELDSNFVQAYLRYDLVNDWNVQEPDARVHARLLVLKDSLPERDRLWVETRELNLPVPAQVTRWKALVQRFPDYPPILMAAADRIVHSGPLYGIPITDAAPYLERLVQLVPDYADAKFHLGIMYAMSGTSEQAASMLSTAWQNLAPPLSQQIKFISEMFAARTDSTLSPSAETIIAAARAGVSASEGPFVDFSGLIGLFPVTPKLQLEALDDARKAGVYTSTATELASALGEGQLRVDRGDWSGGLAALKRAESSSLSVSARATSARVAVTGAWLGAVSPATADSALLRVQEFSKSDTLSLDRVELLWLDGLQGVTLGDSARVERARRGLGAETSKASRYATRSLAGLWMDHSKKNAAVDSLKAATESAIENGGMLVSVEAIDRFVVARGLRRRGTPKDAERYLMWVDAAFNTNRSATIQNALGPLVRYERGVALAEAGDPSAALYQLRKFVDAYDMAAGAQRALVDDAKQRIAKLETTDAGPKPKTVPR